MSTYLFIVACGVLTYTGFCRLVHTRLDTLVCVRQAIWGLTVSAMFCIASVLVWGYEPGWPSAVLATCIAALQVVTSVLWKDGQPPPFVQPHGVSDEDS